MNNDVVTYSAPNGMSKADIHECLTVIEEGDAVNLESAEHELPQAVVVAVKRDGKTIVGVGAIKRKRPDYASQVARRSGFYFDNAIHELGYVAVRVSHRGQKLSHEIMETLLSAFQDRPIFATTSNEYMKRTLEKAGFIQKGAEWCGSQNKLLSLWIKVCLRPTHCRV